MIGIDVSGRGRIEIEHLVLDFNGTLACDGHLLAGVSELIAELAKEVTVHVMTADTFGTAATALGGLPCRVEVLAAGAEDEAKERFVEQLGAGATAAIGNGLNDRRMLAKAALGLAVMQAEGAAAQTLLAADLVFTDVRRAFEALLRPRRIVAGLRT